jgi:predicted PurR-regulated permease PerM
MARGESRRDLLSEPAEESEMTRLMLILFSMASTTLMGIAIVIALTMGLDTLQPILVAAALGFVAAIPVSWLLARRLS